MRTDSWLEHIDCPADLKKVPEEALPGLCTEIRDFLIQKIETIKILRLKDITSHYNKLYS